MKSESVIVTIVEFKGSIPQNLGAKAFINSEGLEKGTIGGGKLEAKATQKAQEILKDKSSLICQLITWNLTKDIGMTCGGEITLLFEVNRGANWKIVVFGAGHVSQELVPMLVKLDCEVTCVDTRSEWIEKLPTATNLITKLVAEPKDIIQEFSEQHFFILMTQGHSTDLPILAETLRRYPKAPYIGVIGSKIKSLSLKNALKQMDFNEEKINKFFCPIGLDLGTNSPVEIAYSVVAQLLQVRDQKL